MYLPCTKPVNIFPPGKKIVNLPPIVYKDGADTEFCDRRPRVWWRSKHAFVFNKKLYFWGFFVFSFCPKLFRLILLLVLLLPVQWILSSEWKHAFIRTSPHVRTKTRGRLRWRILIKLRWRECAGPRTDGDEREWKTRVIYYGIIVIVCDKWRQYFRQGGRCTDNNMSACTSLSSNERSERKPVHRRMGFMTTSRPF